MLLLERLSLIGKWKRGWSIRRVAILGTWCFLLASVEIAGRQSPNDAADLVLAGLLVSLTAMLHLFKELPPISWLLGLLRRAKTRILQCSIEVGVDFWETPPIPRRFPSLWLGRLAVLLCFSFVLLIGLPYIPTEARNILKESCYLVYLVLLAMVWSSLILATAFLAVLAWALVRDSFASSFRKQGPGRVRKEALAITALTVLLAVGWMILPPWTPFAVYGVCLLAVTLALGLFSRIPLVWRRRGSDAVYSMDVRLSGPCIWATLTFVTVDLVLLASGDLLWPTSVPASDMFMPITHFLGQVLAWVAVAGIGSLAWHSIWFASLGMRFNSRRIAKSIASNADLQDPKRYRRWEIEQRRKLVRGLERLFKLAARVPRQSGTGYWVGLQHWFTPGLMRDESDVDRDTALLDDVIGPRFHRVFHSETRFHFRQMTRALAVDLIFIEDGVSFRRFVRVLRMMFEVYDVHGGRQRAEEKHFTGLPGIRVVVHEFAIASSESHGRQDYPEPDYDQIGRARILHVFKDRGGNEDPNEVPDTREGIPVLSGV